MYLFYKLITGKYVPDKLWLSKIFRIKFFLRTILFPVTTFHYLHKLSSLPQLTQMINAQGLLPVKLHRPYLRTGISVAKRAKTILDHYKAINELSNSKLRNLLQTLTHTKISTLKGKNNEEFIIYCRPGRFDREGEITLVLQYQNKTIVSLSFSIFYELKELTLLIGGLQGPKKNILNINILREATKAAFGIFPKRLVMETLFLLAKECKIKKILAVGDSTHVLCSLRYRHRKYKTFFAKYSKFWISLGGKIQSDKLFLLPSEIKRKKIEEISSKKRSKYKKRLELLNSLNHQLFLTIGKTPKNN